jgi:hypothetical protein
MIRNSGKLLLALCLLVVGGGIVANAQINSVPQLEINVPFAFAVGDAKLPAGRYEIRTPEDVSPNVLEIRSVDRRMAVIFDTEAAETRGDQIENKTEIIFDKVGDQYFLRQIWVSGSSSGSELRTSRMEKRLASGNTQPERHSLVAVMRHLKP